MAPPNYQSHNQPSPPSGWLREYFNERIGPPVEGSMRSRIARYIMFADWYKHRTERGVPLDRGERNRHAKLMFRASEAAFNMKQHLEDTRQFDRFLIEQFSLCEPRVPGFPLVEWLAVQIYWWYLPTSWVVDLTADDWLVQLREADERKSFSMAECRAHAFKAGYEIPLLEEMMLQYITREPSNLLGGFDEE